jgi:hypothetical protein
MAGDFSVRINRRDGVLEIEGSDMEWIAAQLERLAVVYEEQPVTGPSKAPSTASPAPPVAAPSTSSKPQTSPAPARARKGSGRGAHRASRKPELEQVLTPELRTALQAYVNERSATWKRNTSQAAIIATFLMDNGGWGGYLDDDDLYTVYSVMGWPAPSNFRAQINNARHRNGYFGNWTEGRVQITHAGEQFGRHGSKTS